MSDAVILGFRGVSAPLNVARSVKVPSGILQGKRGER